MSDTLEVLAPVPVEKGLILERIAMPAVKFVEGTVELRDQILAKAGFVETVTNDDEQALAAEVLRDLKAFAGTIEQSRVEVKAPVLGLGKAIDTAAKDLLAQVTTESARIQAALTAYQREMIRRQQEAEAQIRREQERVAREQREAQARLDAAAAEEARKAAAGQQTQEQAAAKVQEVAKAEIAHVQAVVTDARSAISAASVVVPSRAAGMTVRQSWNFEVVDLAALYAARPELCTLEVKRAAVLQVIRSGAREIPGLRIFEDVQAGVRG